jgi:hypothetical protein
VVRAEVKLTFKIVWQVIRAVAIRRYWYLALVGVIPLFAIPLAYWMCPQWFYPILLIILFFPVFVFEVLPLYHYLAARKQWDASPLLRETWIYEFDERGIRYATQTARTEFDWSLVREVGMVGNMIVLADVADTHHILPLSSVPPDQRGELEDLFRTNVPGFTGLQGRFSRNAMRTLESRRYVIPGPTARSVSQAVAAGPRRFHRQWTP